MYFVIEMTVMFRSCLVCIVELSYPFRGLIFSWQEYDVPALSSLDSVSISERSNIDLRVK